MDDTVLTVNSPEELQQFMNELYAANNEVVLKINLAITKVMYNDQIDAQDKKSAIQLWS